MARGSVEVQWPGGATAQLEVFSPTGSDGPFLRKYTSSPPGPIQPPLEELRIAPGALGGIDRRLDKLVGEVKATRGSRTRASTEPSQLRVQAMTDLELLGQLLYRLVVRPPGFIAANLKVPNLFLKVGIDDKPVLVNGEPIVVEGKKITLIDLPWELMHDGSEFLCLKSRFGRFVNAAAGYGQIQPGGGAAAFDRLSVLLVCVPQPRRAKALFPFLRGAELEADAILRTLSGLGVETLLLKGADATDLNLQRAAFGGRQFQIVHFIGHADPVRGLMLFDQDMPVGFLEPYFGASPPVLFFVNACETARKTEHLYDLASDLLRTGAYLLGSRWKLSDQVGSRFAPIFYEQLLKHSKSLGEAIQTARKSCLPGQKFKSSVTGQMEEINDPFGWASYVFYGDPRLGFG